MRGTRQILENMGFILLCLSMLQISLAWLDCFLGAGSYLFEKAGSYLFIFVCILQAITPCAKKVVWPRERNYSFEIVSFGYILLLIIYWWLAMQVNIHQSFFLQSFPVAFRQTFLPPKFLPYGISLHCQF